MRAGSFARVLGASPGLHVGTRASSTVTGFGPHGSVVAPTIVAVAGRDRGRHLRRARSGRRSGRRRGSGSATMASSAASRAAAAARPGLAYSLGRTLYLSVTNRSNAASILDTRGPGFRMPESSGFLLLPDDAPEPTSDELAAVVDACYADMDIVGMGENDPGVVFAGAGEPLLRPDVLVDTVRKVRADFSRHGVPFRVHTNGLHPPSVVAALADAAVDRVTVALATADPRQYDALMRPHPNAGGHADVCGFVAECVEAGVPVECVVVEAPGVDVAAARKLAIALGAVEFRTREYFPA